MASENIVLEGHSRRAVERLAHFGQQKIRLDDSVDEATRKIVRAYGKAWRVTSGEARAMSQYAAEQMHSGRGLSPRDIAKMDRIDRAQHALERQIRDLTKFTGVTVSGATRKRTEQDVDRVLNSLASLTGLDRHFTKPSGAAMEGLILRSTGRIEAASRRLVAAQATALKDGLFRGLVLGENPRQTARHIYDQTEGAFFGGLNRATTIARTEIADANRYASRLVYGETDLVVGWKWLAQLDGRTCPACWAMHNTFHEKSEMQFGHQNCRCTTVPVLADDLPEDNDLGDPEDIFWNLPRETQLQIMGPGRLKALEAGARFSDLTYLKHNPGWRPAQQVTNVADLQGLAELNIATTPGDVITIPGETNESILAHAYRQGGLTINALTGDVPTSGYVVARNGTSDVIDAREFFGPAGPPRVAAWLTKHGDRLDQPGAHMGMWYDTANGKVVLDVVEILKDRDAAIALGRAEDQIAIFDLDTFTEINTGGTGGYAQGLTANLGQADVGRLAIVRQNGKTYSGKVTIAGEWGARLVLADGTEINAAPDQISFTTGPDKAVLDKVNTIDAIEDAGRARHGVHVRYAGADPKAAQELDDAITGLRHDWPDVKPGDVEIGHNPHAYATTTTSFLGDHATSVITVNKDSASNYAAWRNRMGEDEASGHFHRGTSGRPAAYTIEHEWGHVLDNALFGDPRIGSGRSQHMVMASEVFNALIDKYHLDQPKFSTTTISQDRINAAWKTQMRDLVTKDLSGYATKDFGEMIAEAFAVYRNRGRGESAVADTVMDAFARAYRAKYGHAPNLKEFS